jgi:F0F1-type ATP synthase assembly protein I
VAADQKNDSVAPSLKPVEERASDAVKMSSVGADFAATVLVCGGLGWYADRTFGMAPWGMIGMVFLGAIVAFVNVARALGGFEPNGLGWRKKPSDDERKE